MKGRSGLNNVISVNVTDGNLIHSVFNPVEILELFPMDIFAINIKSKIFYVAMIFKEDDINKK